MELKDKVFKTEHNLLSELMEVYTAMYGKKNEITLGKLKYMPKGDRKDFFQHDVRAFIAERVKCDVDTLEVVARKLHEAFLEEENVLHYYYETYRSYSLK